MTKNHPTQATLKDLYTHAYLCAFPECTKPLYQIDNETGIRTLNSLAIPIWNKTQTPELTANNLLAVCLNHASEINTPEKAAQYTTKEFRAWKKQQLLDFDTLGKQGWSLRAEDIKQLQNYFDIPTPPNLDHTHKTLSHFANGIKDTQQHTNHKAPNENAITNPSDTNTNIINLFQIKNEKLKDHSDIAKLARALTKAEFDDGASISTLLLAEVIQLKDGLANLLGACWDQYKVPKLPFTVPLPLFLIFSLPKLNTPSVIHCKIKVRNPNKRIITDESVDFAKLNHQTQRVMHIQSLAVEVTQLGLWTIEITSGDILLATQTITISS